MGTDALGFSPPSVSAFTDQPSCPPSLSAGLLSAPLVRTRSTLGRGSPPGIFRTGVSAMSALGRPITNMHYYAGSDSCRRSPPPTGLPAYLASPSCRSTPNHVMPPVDRFTRRTPASTVSFRLRRLPVEQAALVEQCTLAHEGRPVRLVVVAQCLELVACGMHPTGPTAIRPTMASSCQRLKRVCTHGVDERDQQGRAIGEQALEDRVVLRIEQRLYPGLFCCAEGVARTAGEGDGRRTVAFSRPGARSRWTESRSPRVPSEVGVPRGAR
jgi:hypothetical protein